MSDIREKVASLIRTCPPDGEYKSADQAIELVQNDDEALQADRAMTRALTIVDAINIVESVEPNNDGEDSYQRRIISLLKGMKK